MEKEVVKEEEMGRRRRKRKRRDGRRREGRRREEEDSYRFFSKNVECNKIMEKIFFYVRKGWGNEELCLGKLLFKWLWLSKLLCK